MTKSKIEVKDINNLRDHAIQTLDMLVSGEIEIEDAMAASKLYGNVVDMLRVQVDYNKYCGNDVQIDFLTSGTTKTIIHQTNTTLENEIKPKRIGI